ARSLYWVLSTRYWESPSTKYQVPNSDRSRRTRSGTPDRSHEQFLDRPGPEAAGGGADHPAHRHGDRLRRDEALRQDAGPRRSLLRRWPVGLGPADRRRRQVLPEGGPDPEGRRPTGLQG